MSEVFLLLALLAIIPADAPSVNHCYTAYVDRVIDGDTFVADISLGWDIWLLDQSVRIRNCWAPELLEPGGAASKDSLEALLDGNPNSAGWQSGAEVVIRSGSAKRLGEREKYGRILADVFASGVSVGAEQVRQGRATFSPAAKLPAPARGGATPPSSSPATGGEE